MSCTDFDAAAGGEGLAFEEQELFCPAEGTELLQDTPVQEGEMLILKPWNLKIVEEG